MATRKIGSTLAALFALSFATGAWAQDSAKIEQAKAHMKAGAAFYNDPSGHKCEEAIREFSIAFELSGSLNALKGMAVCNLELERDGEAIDQYTKYLAGKGAQLDPSEKQQVENDLAALKAGVATIKLGIDRPNARIVDVRTPSRGFPVRNEYQVTSAGRVFGLHPGEHTFTASADGAPDLVWKLEIPNGSNMEHVFEFSKAPPPVVAGGPAGPQFTRPVGLPIYIAGGATIVLAGITTGLMIHAKSLNTDYQNENGKLPANQLEAANTTVSNANTTADIFLGTTIAAAGATVVLYLIRPKKPIADQPAVGRFTVTPAAGPGFAMGTFKASF